MNAPDGTPVNAVYGILTMLMKLLQNYNPSHIVLARDTRGGSFRNELYSEYKANRGAPPEELVPQFALIEELIEKMGIPHLAVEGYEADDLIGSYVVQFKKDFDEVLIASGDKDLMQFVGDNVKMVDTMKDKMYGREEIYEKMGVYPEQVADYLTLLGDSSDNIPGVRGIGAKGAAKLLAEYETLDKLLANIDMLTNKRAKTALEKAGDEVHLSKKLVTIVTDIDLGHSVDCLQYSLEPNDDLLGFLDKLNFKSIRTKIATGAGNSVMVTKPKSFIDHEVIKEEKRYKELIEILQSEDQLYIEPFFTHDDYHKIDPVVFGVAIPERNFLLYTDDFKFSSFIKDISTIPGLRIVSSNIKTLYFCMYEEGLDTYLDAFDLTQAHFVLDPEKKHNLQTMAMEFIQENVPLIKDLRKENFEEHQSKTAFESGFAKRLFAGIRVFPWLIRKLQDNDLYRLYTELDSPLMAILARMEWYGVELDTKMYKKLEKEFSKITEDIDQKIKEVSGEEVNLKSPKQVSKLLFEDLGLPIIKKTKTGASTDASVLEKLDLMGESEIPGLIIQYREIDKLNSTYVKSLPELVHEDGRIHTHFNQHIAATGRLSSDKPNLQNIPTRTENGRKLRAGFKAAKGYQLLGADYSQVELRLLAHFSQDPVMLKAFNDGKDIHAQTASEVFEIDLEDVSSEDRRYAKAINFGLMYGQTSFGLSQMLGITQRDAKEYITNYFTRFHKVKSYLDTLIESCEEKGYSETLFGRKRYIKDINSTNRQVKSMAERMAINSPIQGTAADIIKKAMLDIDEAMKSEGLGSRMLLQVHDELIFEVPESEIDLMKSLVRSKMENAVELSVELKVDMGCADNWYDLK
tara:strand:+ start:13 stop:2586 length:2574 start_codon:yes stop_codon:yes gene_type:complete